jgi:hypothetical protein
MERYLPAEEQHAVVENMRRLEGQNDLTYLLDGWDDSMQRSIYGSLLAEVGVHPVILDLQELMGI